MVLYVITDEAGYKHYVGASSIQDAINIYDLKAGNDIVEIKCIGNIYTGA